MTVMTDTRTETPTAAAAAEPPTFEKPAPGTWTLDASHCERPLPRFTEGVFEASFGRGFRDGLAAYGALLETIEAAAVNGFLYTCVRPLGAPPEAKGPPPKPIFKLLTWLHPELRRRNRRAEAAFDEKLWRTERARYLDEWAHDIQQRVEALLGVDLAALDDDDLAGHLASCRALLLDDTYVHHRVNCTRVVPVGDLMAHAVEWTGASREEVLEALRGASPYSEEGLAELAALAARVQEDDAFRALVASGTDAEATIAALEADDGPVGDAMRRWTSRVGHRPTGFSPGYPSLRESPISLLGALRESLSQATRDDAEEAGRAAAARLRARVPEAHRATFDALLEEARSVYFIRDHSCNMSLDVFGLARHALLEAGRRLAARGAIDAADHALDLTLEELRAMLGDGGAGPGAGALRARVHWRETARAEDVPERLGPVAGGPPPDEWLPPAAARLQRALQIYVSAMFDEVEADAARGPVVKGLAASGGKARGTARLVLDPGDFERVRKGDVLVTRVTTPTYNVLLPLLAGVVTDRGGVLSHPAIVSREYGIPGVVGTRVATQVIADGATVEIDGDAGTVTVIG